MENNLENAVAIVGMAGRFPGAKDIWQFWDNIKNGVESISDFSDKELLSSGIDPDLINDSAYIKRKAVLQDIDMFDAEFFNYSPKEAKLMDPQHRILLEVCYDAMENYGFNKEVVSDEVGVFVSSSFGTYLMHNLSNNSDIISDISSHQFCIANSNDFLATKIAYKLDLKGPAQTVQTACSSSLVAVHSAYQSLINYECDAAIAGGVSITLPNKAGYKYQRDGICSKDGKCRPFDKDASGTIAGNGAGAVIIKRLEDAINDNDNIYAVIKGSAINNDGSQKMGFTAPSASGQAKVISMAQSFAEIEPKTIGLIEAHGTATSLGDPIEIDGLTRAFTGSEKPVSQYCAITASKANIGHLDAAAGIAGFIKAVMSVYHGQIPPSLNYNQANSHIDFSKTPFYVNKDLKDWPENNFPRRAGISSFGIGGTNAHVVIEEFINKKQAKQNLQEVYILPISAKTEESLVSQKADLLDMVSSIDNCKLKAIINDIAYTLKYRRAKYQCNDVIILKLINGEYQVVSDPNISSHQVHSDITGKVYNNLPSYSFSRKSYWFDEGKKVSNNNKVKVSLGVRYDVREALCNLLELEDVNIYEEFYNIGADSLMLLDFQMILEKEYGYKVSSSDLAKYDSIDKLTNFIESNITEVSSHNNNQHKELLIDIKTGDKNLPTLFCIHPAGGSTTIFNDLARYIDDNQNVVGVRAMGLYEGEQIDRDIKLMARRYVNAIYEVQENGPYMLLGGSLGGTIAYEMAQIIQKEDKKISLLAMLDSPPPSLPIITNDVPDSDTEILSYIRHMSLSMAESLDSMLSKQNVSVEKFFALWRAHKYLAEQYRAERYDGNIVYFRAGKRDKYLANNMELGWYSLAKRGLELHETPANHLTMYLDPFVKNIAEILNDKINNIKCLSAISNLSALQEYRGG